MNRSPNVERDNGEQKNIQHEIIRKVASGTHQTWHEMFGVVSSIEPGNQLVK